MQALLGRPPTRPWRRRAPEAVQCGLFHDLIRAPSDPRPVFCKLWRARAVPASARLSALWSGLVVDPKETMAAFRALEAHIFAEEQPLSYYTVQELDEFDWGANRGVQCNLALRLERLCRTYRRRIAARHLIGQELAKYWHRPRTHPDGRPRPAPYLECEMRKLCELGLLTTGDGDEETIKTPLETTLVCSES